ncbi:MAG: hypothetical protein RLZZ558_1615 [Planctomycetota bacterium]|jgi:hypothetical protein
MRFHIRSVAVSLASALCIAMVVSESAQGQVAGGKRPTAVRDAKAPASPQISRPSAPYPPDVKPDVVRAYSGRPPVDVDPSGPIKARAPFPKWAAAGLGSIEAQLGDRARLTDRIFVKFRDDLRVRTGFAPSTDLWRQESTAGMPKAGIPDLEPQDPLAEARALLAMYGATVEQAIKIPQHRLSAIEQRAVNMSRTAQPDLGGFMLVTVGRDRVRAAAEAFNALECVEFANVELRPRTAQCQPLDQSLQKGPGDVGTNVLGCTQGTDQNGNPFICQPYPVLAIQQPFQRITLGFVNCNRPSFWAGYVPIDNQPDPDGNSPCPPANGYTPDLVTVPLWDCTPSCNNANACNDATSTFFTQGGNPTCQYGCADEACANLVAQYQPNCIDPNSFQGWDATCATIAALVCPGQVNAATPYNGIIGGSGTGSAGAIAMDQVTFECFQNTPPGPAVTAYDFNFNWAYDPCFIARGPANYNLSAGVGVVAYTDIGDGAGIRPWAFDYEAAVVTMPPYSYLQFETPDPADTFASPDCASIGTVYLGGTALSANTFDETLAGLATRDPVFKSGPESFSHPCLEESPVPGCVVPQCCAFVCIQDPSCCDVGWDAGCVDLAESNPGLCGQGELGMPALAGSPTPNFAAVEGTATATNLQLYTTNKPLVSSTQQYIQTVPTPDLGNPAVVNSGIVPLSTVTTQGQLNETYAFINSQFGGGGLDLDGLENFALALDGVTQANARGLGVRIGVIDYSAYLNHEDLVGQVTVEQGQSVFLQPGGDIDPNHGTAVLGIMVAAANGIGITGVAPESEAIFYPAANGNQAGRLATAIVSAGEDLDVGDVLCIPLELGLGGGATVCSDPTFNVLLGVTASLGVTNVCAAGNGGFATLTPGSGVNNAVLVSAVWPGPQTPTPVSGAKTFDAAGTVTANTLQNPGNVAPGNSYCRYKSSNYSTENPGTSAAVDVSGWGTSLCTLGGGTLWNGANASTNPLEVNELRSYQQSFTGTSGAAAMIAGLVARLQAVAKASLGSPVSGERIRQVLANQLWLNGDLVVGSNGLPVTIGTAIPQCNLAPGVPLPGTLSDAFFVVAFGDLIPANSASQINLVGGFPLAVDCLQQVIFTQFYPQGIFFTIEVITGQQQQSSVFDAALLDGAFFRVNATRKGRGGTGAGYGRPLIYAANGLATDLQLRNVLAIQEAEDLFQLSIRAWGKTSVGTSGDIDGNTGITGQALAMAYVYDNVYGRWRYLDFGFVTGVVDEPNLAAQVTDFGYPPANFAIREGNDFVAYVRVLTFSAGIVGGYEMWWDQILVSTSPVAQP